MYRNEVKASHWATFARQSTLINAKLTFVLDYQNITRQFPPQKKKKEKNSMSISHIPPNCSLVLLSLNLTVSCIEWSCLIARSRKWGRLTVNSIYQRPSGCIYPPPLLSRGHGGFGSLFSRIVNLMMPAL